jgi:hypothetical protein
MSYLDNMRTVILRIKTTKEKVKDAEKALKDEKYFEDRINKDAERDEDLFKHNCTRIQEGYIRVPFNLESIEKLKAYLKDAISENFELVLVEDQGQTEFVLPSGELLGYMSGYPVYTPTIEE